MPIFPGTPDLRGSDMKEAGAAILAACGFVILSLTIIVGSVWGVVAAIVWGLKACGVVH